MKRPPVQQIVQKYAEELKREFANAQSEYAHTMFRNQIFTLELLAVKCGWEKLSDDLEAWREKSYASETFEPKGAE